MRKNLIHMKFSDMTDRQFAVYCAVASVIMICGAYLARMLVCMATAGEYNAGTELVHVFSVVGPMTVVADICFVMKRCHQMPETEQRAQQNTEAE